MDNRQARFEVLQKKLIPLWKSIRSLNQDEQTIVVVPSISIDVDFRGTLLQAYEERFLFLLLLLRQPRARLVYVTSQPIQPELIDYYLHLLPGIIPSHARRRLFLVSPHDASARPLSRKLLDRPWLLAKLRSLILDPERAHMVPFLTTDLERDLALELGIPMYGADPKFFPLGTKSGSRRIFKEEGIPHPLGREDLRTLEDLVEAVGAIRAERPAVRQVVVKLDEGVSGQGNALVDLGGVPEPGKPGEARGIADALRAMRFELEEVRFEDYMSNLSAHGGIVEERIQGTDFRSPSAQLRITPLGEVERLSTHDQLLGGPGGQSYLGCRFPADPAYGPRIMAESHKAGLRLAREGVLGRFAIDFVTVRNEKGEWEAYAIEINLRKGGTTHPFLTLQFLTDGAFHPEKGLFLTPRGREKHLVASDHVEAPGFRLFTPDLLFDIAARRGLHFDQSRQAGVVFHMLSSLGEFGQMGLTAVGDTAGEADDLYLRALAILESEAGSDSLRFD
jgi:hypothetical protein